MVRRNKTGQFACSPVRFVSLPRRWEAKGIICWELLAGFVLTAVRLGQESRLLHYILDRRIFHLRQKQWTELFDLWFEHYASNIEDSMGRSAFCQLRWQDIFRHGSPLMLSNRIRFDQFLERTSYVQKWLSSRTKFRRNRRVGDSIRWVAVWYEFVFFKSTELRRFAGSPVRRSPVRTVADSPVRRSPPTMCAGSVVLNALESRSAGYSDWPDVCAICALRWPKTGDFFRYKKTARFQLRHALLEVARTAGRRARRVGSRDGLPRLWPLTASRFEGRSPSMLRSWSNMRRSISSTCTLEVDTATRRSPVRRFAGVPICCVERWNLIRRYADSPVYQSVVLNVGIWYAGTPIRRCTNLLCWTLESDTPVRRFAGVPICCVERWNLIDAGTPIRRCTNLLCWTLESDSPVYADSPVYQSVVLNVGICNRFACVRRFAGVPICCVERWNLIRRYADSPVYQSVVLNVGIWYAEWW